MTRRPDGNWEIEHRELRFWVFLLPLVQIVFAAGAAYAGVHYGLDGKVDRAAFAVHVQDTALALERLRIADSLQQDAQRVSNDRLREVVCEAVKTKACR
jgi:hypothetical protein